MVIPSAQNFSDSYANVKILTFKDDCQEMFKISSSWITDSEFGVQVTVIKWYEICFKIDLVWIEHNG
jgi:hypothetical protein